MSDSTTEHAGSAAGGIEPWLRDIIRCPRCTGLLTDSRGSDGAELHCPACSLAYTVDDGVPVLLVELARPLGD
ncbi:MAG: Trm112 family protein [Terracoccus sp.]